MSVDGCNSIHEYNVGGEKFYFSTATIQLEHNKGSTLERYESSPCSKTIPFLDVDPALFRKFCAPYIRHAILPTLNDFSSLTEQKQLVATANYVGLVELGIYVKNELLNKPFSIAINIYSLEPNSRLKPTAIKIIATAVDTFSALGSKLGKITDNFTHREAHAALNFKEPDKIGFFLKGSLLDSDKTLDFYGIGPAAELDVTSIEDIYDITIGRSNLPPTAAREAPTSDPD